MARTGGGYLNTSGMRKCSFRYHGIVLANLKGSSTGGTDMQSHTPCSYGARGTYFQVQVCTRQLSRGSKYPTYLRFLSEKSIT